MIVEVGYVSRHGHGEYVGRPQSPLGNPWSHKPSRYALRVESVGRSLALYAEWLAERLRIGALEPNQQRVEMDRLKTLLRLHDKITPRCWCSEAIRPVLDPPQCHADIIGRRLLEELGCWPPIPAIGQLSLL